MSIGDYTADRAARPTPAQTALIERAIEVFVHGFRFTQGFTHPYLAERVGPLWVMRDAPRTRGQYRTEEWVAYGGIPVEVDQVVRQQTRGHFLLSLICRPDEAQAPLRLAYKALGYRLIRTESLMSHSLAQILAADAPATIVRVMTAAMADGLMKAAVVRQLLPIHLTADAPLRAYVALVDDQIVGWVRSIMVGDATWCSNMYVRPEFRRRGIARAMLDRMLHDDVSHGAQLAVLLASHTGAMLYSAVGYKQIGTMLLYTLSK